MEDFEDFISEIYINGRNDMTDIASCVDLDIRSIATVIAAIVEESSVRRIMNVGMQMCIAKVLATTAVPLPVETATARRTTPT